MPQLDGNISISSSYVESEISDESEKIPVIVSLQRIQPTLVSENSVPVRIPIKRNNQVLKSLDLPVILNINPRSLYNKTDDFALIVEQYDADVICLSETWERPNLNLEDILKLENYEISYFS